MGRIVFSFLFLVAGIFAENTNCCKDNWYFSIKPGYFFIQDGDMKQFFGMGGFSLRGEFDYMLRGPLLIWVDGGYYQETGTAVGGSQALQLQVGTVTLGLKWKIDFSSWGAFYAGIGPRLFLMKIQNDSPFVRGEDNAFGVGGGFDAGFWIFPIPQWKNLFLDFYADYSHKEIHVDPDEVSSIDNDINLSGFTAGVGLGFRF